MPRATKLHALTAIVGSALLVTACGGNGEQSQAPTSSKTSATTTTSVTSTTSASAEQLDASASALASQAAQLSKEAQAQEPHSTSRAASTSASPAYNGQRGNSAESDTAQVSTQAQGNTTSQGNNSETANSGTGEQQEQSGGDAQQSVPDRIYDPNPGDAQDTPVGQLYYSNCGQALTDGALPLHRGEPGYREALDRDGDGIACEPENWPEHEAWPTPTKLPQAYSGEEIQRLKDDPNIDYEPDPGIPGPPPKL